MIIKLNCTRFYRTDIEEIRKIGNSKCTLEISKNLKEKNFVKCIIFLVPGKSELLVEGGKTVNGHPLSFLDDLVVLNNGTVLFTDASSRFARRDFMLNFLEHANDGR